MRKFLFCIIVGLLLGSWGKTVQAQPVQVKMGPRLGLDRYGFRYFTGADARVEIPSLALGSQQLPILINPFFSYYFSVGGPEDIVLSVVEDLSQGFSSESSGSLSRFGANALINVSEWGTGEDEGTFFDVYIGAGLTLSRVSYEQKITVDEGLSGDGGSISYNGSDLIPGLNLVTNATFSGNSFGTPFLQARVTLAPRASVALQRSVDEESTLLENYPESRKYQSWGGTSFFALSVGLLFGL